MWCGVQGEGMSEDIGYKPISVGEWFWTFFLLAIPLVNVVMLLVWALSSGTQPSKKSYAQASLLCLVALAVLGAALALILPALASQMR